MLPTTLRHLEHAGLIRLALPAVADVYLFRHALVHEAAYQSLLRRDRKTLHQLVGETLESLGAATWEDGPARLAHHFVAAGAVGSAVQYLTLAGEQAAQRFANAEAVGHYAQAVTLCEQHLGAEPTVAALTQLQNLVLALGRLLELLGRQPEALAHYAALQARAQAQGDLSIALAALIPQVTLRATPTMLFDAAQGQVLAAQALALARQLGDQPAEQQSLWNLMLLAQHAGRLAESVAYGEQALALARALALPERAAFALNDLAAAYSALNHIASARAAWAEVRDLWRTLENWPMLADSLGGAAFLEYLCGDFAQCRALAEEGVAVSQRIGNGWGEAFNVSLLGFAWFDAGQWGAALTALHQSVTLGEQSGVIIAAGAVRADLAWMYAVVGDAATARSLATLARAVLAQPQPPVLRVWGLARLALLEVALGQPAQAAVDLAQASDVGQSRMSHAPFLVALAQCELATAQRDWAALYTAATDLQTLRERTGIQVFLPEAQGFLGQARAAQAQWATAEAHFREAVGLATALPLGRRLWQFTAALAGVVAQQGRTAEAQTLRAQAQAQAQRLAATLPAPQHELFLATPAMRELCN